LIEFNSNISFAKLQKINQSKENNSARNLSVKMMNSRNLKDEMMDGSNTISNRIKPNTMPVPNGI
jgi:hypothetical protein